MMFENEMACRLCGCTDHDCPGCVEKTGEACYWVADGVCSACVQLLDLKPILVVFTFPGYPGQRQFQRYWARDARQASNMACNEHGNRIRFITSRIPFGTGCLGYKGDVLGWNNPDPVISVDHAKPGGDMTCKVSAGRGMEITSIETVEDADKVPV